MNEILILTAPQPTRSDAVKNRALLLETAERLFAEQGVEAATMSAIAETARVGKGTLYRHFENKGQLCHALLDQKARELQDGTLRRLQAGGDPLDDLRWFLVEMVRYVVDNEALLCASSRDGIPTLEHPAHWWARQTIRGLLGQLELVGDVDYVADLLYVMLDARTLRFLRRVRGYTTDRIVEGLNETLTKLVAG